MYKSETLKAPETGTELPNYLNYSTQIKKARHKEIKNEAKPDRIEIPAFYNQSCSGLKGTLLHQARKAALILLGQVLALLNF